MLFDAELALVVVGALILGGVALAAFHVLTWRLTPKGDRRYSAYRTSDGYMRLAREGFGIEGYDYSRQAGAVLLRSRGLTP